MSSTSASSAAFETSGGASRAPGTPRRRAGATARRVLRSGFATGMWRILGLSMLNQSGRSPSFSAIQITLLKSGVRSGPTGLARTDWLRMRARVKSWRSAGESASDRTNRRDAKSATRQSGGPFQPAKRSRVEATVPAPRGALALEGDKPSPETGVPHPATGLSADPRSGSSITGSVLRDVRKSRLGQRPGDSDVQGRGRDNVPYRMELQVPDVPRQDKLAFQRQEFVQVPKPSRFRPGRERRQNTTLQPSRTRDLPDARLQVERVFEEVSAFRRRSC